MADGGTDTGKNWCHLTLSWGRPQHICLIIVNPLLNVVQSVALVIQVSLFEDLKSVFVFLLGIMFEGSVAE